MTGGYERLIGRQEKKKREWGMGSEDEERYGTRSVRMSGG